MDPIYDAFLQDIFDSGPDLTPTRIFADRLIDDGHHLGDYLSAQCRLADLATMTRSDPERCKREVPPLRKLCRQYQSDHLPNCLKWHNTDFRGNPPPPKHVFRHGVCPEYLRVPSCELLNSATGEMAWYWYSGCNLLADWVKGDPGFDVLNSDALKRFKLFRYTGTIVSSGINALFCDRAWAGQIHDLAISITENHRQAVDNFLCIVAAKCHKLKRFQIRDRQVNGLVGCWPTIFNSEAFQKIEAINIQLGCSNQINAVCTSLMDSSINPDCAIKIGRMWLRQEQIVRNLERKVKSRAVCRNHMLCFDSKKYNHIDAL